ncbi:hypothetical protein M431DRAFT_497229 [Trichoderma harzianum CBS 226.95]|uniref:Uncharacterized protein n=1 Tax=Trichoderma harzianum CBS 226.95 TaxID=983964 RepID=A0A2T4A765_TRIHA|nr:hypothetical protein M431DRAFT_497229 [Trichoderma harzianum CBS 226.95]PTB52914.1 hypothetical protein M431DRAFT_497229 [Trichoderma harzianum CBS 226.95]
MRASNAISGEGREGQALDKMEPPQEKSQATTTKPPESLRLQFWRRARGGEESQVPSSSRKGPSQARNFSPIIGHTMVPPPFPHGRPSNVRSDKTAGRCPEKSVRRERTTACHVLCSGPMLHSV